MPFATPLKAMIQENNRDIAIKVRKSYDEGYVNMTSTGLKKARKGLEIHQKKVQKATEKAVRYLNPVFEPF
jgi:hypothetical protein